MHVLQHMLQNKKEDRQYVRFVEKACCKTCCNRDLPSFRVKLCLVFVMLNRFLLFQSKWMVNPLEKPLTKIIQWEFNTIRWPWSKTKMYVCDSVFVPTADINDIFSFSNVQCKLLFEIGKDGSIVVTVAATVVVQDIADRFADPFALGEFFVGGWNSRQGFTAVVNFKNFYFLFVIRRRRVG